MRRHAELEARLRAADRLQKEMAECLQKWEGLTEEERIERTQRLESIAWEAGVEAPALVGRSRRVECVATKGAGLGLRGVVGAECIPVKGGGGGLCTAVGAASAGA